MSKARALCCSFGLVVIFAVAQGCQEGPLPSYVDAHLPDLTRAVQAEAFFSSRQIPKGRLVEEVFTKKPNMRTAFNGLMIDVQLFVDQKGVALLVHSPDGKHCWFEDGSWTPFVDRQCYKDKPLPPAQFTLVPPPPDSKPASTSRPSVLSSRPH